MQLVINGEEKTIEDIDTIKDLLVNLGYEINSVAVACGDTFVSRSKYAQYKIKNGEQIEILQPMQGG